MFHLTDQELFKRVEDLMKLMKVGDLSKEEIWNITLFIYPSLGINKKKERKSKLISNELKKVITKKSVIFFRSVFKENNVPKRKEFFTSPLI